MRHTRSPWRCWRSSLTKLAGRGRGYRSRGRRSSPGRRSRRAGRGPCAGARTTACRRGRAFRSLSIPSHATGGVRGVGLSPGLREHLGVRQPVDAVLQGQERGQRGTARAHGERAGGEGPTAQLQPWGGADVNALGRRDSPRAFRLTAVDPGVGDPGFSSRARRTTRRPRAEPRPRVAQLRVGLRPPPDCGRAPACAAGTGAGRR